MAVWKTVKGKKVYINPRLRYQDIYNNSTLDSKVFKNWDISPFKEKSKKHHKNIYKSWSDNKSQSTKPNSKSGWGVHRSLVGFTTLPLR